MLGQLNSFHYFFLKLQNLSNLLWKKPGPIPLMEYLLLILVVLELLKPHLLHLHLPQIGNSIIISFLG